MFKVPEWEDAPTNNLNFTNVSNKKNKTKGKKTRTPEKPKQFVQAKPSFKAKTVFTSKIKLVKTVQKPDKIAKIQKQKTKNKKKHENNKYKKTKYNSNNFVENKQDSDNDIKIQNYDSEKLDELVLDVKKQRFDSYKNDDNEEILFQENTEKITTNSKNHINSIKTNNNTKTNDSIMKTSEQNPNPGLPIVIIKKQNKKDLRKKEILKSILQKESTRNRVTVNGNKLRQRMLDRLKAAQFRYLNEKLYTSSGSDAQKLFQGDPSAFQTYHEGYQQQVKKWPVKPLDVIVKRIQKMPQTHIIADMGCGEADLSKRVAQSVRSFDLVATAPEVEACDMAHTPLLARSVDAVVYCLALMGTDLTQYLLEANRVLKPGGHLLIAEVESRFDDIQAFTSDVQRLGFSLKKLDDTHKVFYFLEFTKLRDPPVKKAKLPTLTLKPCIYKKR